MGDLHDVDPADPPEQGTLHCSPDVAEEEGPEAPGRGPQNKGRVVRVPGRRRRRAGPRPGVEDFETDSAHGDLVTALESGNAQSTPRRALRSGHPPGRPDDAARGEDPPHATGGHERSQASAVVGMTVREDDGVETTDTRVTQQIREAAPGRSRVHEHGLTRHAPQEGGVPLADGQECGADTSR